MKKRFTRLIQVLIMALCSTALQAQTGQGCNDAIPTSINDDCAYESATFPLGATQLWFSFTATSIEASISTQLDNNQRTHIHAIYLVAGSSENS
jgi:hypothetical protein